MTEIDSADAGPTLVDGDNVRQPDGETPPDGALPREAIEARAKLAALANGTNAAPAEERAVDEPAAEPDAPTELTEEESQALRDLKAKYGGDLNKMAESYWEGTREASTLSRELAAMRESIEKLNADKQTAIPEFDPAPEDVPSSEDLQFVVDDIATFETDIKDAQTVMDRALDASDDWKARIARAEGRAEAAEDPDQKAREQAHVRELVAEYNAKVVNPFKEAKASKTRAERELKAKTREKVSIERRIEAERQQLIKANTDNRAKLQEQGQVFNTSVEAAFKATGLPESERALYGETLTAKVSAYLRSLGNAPALTTEALVKVTEAEAAKIAKLSGLGQRTAFAAASATKLAQNAALKAAPTVPGAGVGAKPPKFTSAQEEADWTKRMARERLAAAASRGRQV